MTSPPHRAPEDPSPHALPPSTKEAQLRALLEGMLDPVLTIDAFGIVREASHSVEAVFGYARDELLGRNISILMPEPHRSAHDGYLARYRETGNTWILGTTREFEVLRKDGEEITCELSVSRVDVPDGDPLFIGSFRDVTARRRAHEAQERERAMLRSLATLGESASVLAHEIKNPVTAIHLALRAVADQLGEDQRAVLEDLTQRLQKLERTLRSVLEFARPLNNPREPVVASALLEEVAQTVRPRLEAAGVELVLDARSGAAALPGDGTLLERALANLVLNAVQAIATSGHGGRVVLRSAVDRESLVFTVEDDGPGIPEALEEELFRPFVSGREGGTGLGLAIARKIVEAHGGRLVRAESALGGAGFRATFRREEESS